MFSTVGPARQGCSRDRTLRAPRPRH